MIFWLMAGVLACGALGYLDWRSPRGRRWTRWLEQATESESPALLRARSHPLLRSLFALVLAACITGFAFVFILTGYLPSNRPGGPDIAHDFTYSMTIRHREFYGTHFEWLAVNYGVFVSWGSAVVTGLIAVRLRIDFKDWPLYPLVFLAGSATSMALYYVLWRACL